MAATESAAHTARAAEILQASRSSMSAAMEPGRAVSATSSTSSAEDAQPAFSMVDSVVEGVDHWWDKSAVGRSTRLLAPLVEPYLRPFARRHYQALLLGSAAVLALVSLYPGRSARSVLKVAGPMMLSGVVLEIAKAAFRQRASSSSSGRQAQ